MESFTLFQWIVLAAVAYAAYRLHKFLKASGSGGARGVEPRIRGDGSYAFEVVGESNYQSAFVRLFGRPAEDWEPIQLDATLVLEDNNKFDNKAVRVDLQGETVGYLPRKMARTFRSSLERDGHTHWTSFKVGAEVRGGWDRGGGDRGNFGVWLDLPSA